MVMLLVQGALHCGHVCVSFRMNLLLPSSYLTCLLVAFRSRSEVMKTLSSLRVRATPLMEKTFTFHILFLIHRHALARSTTLIHLVQIEWR